MKELQIWTEERIIACMLIEEGKNVELSCFCKPLCKLILISCALWINKTVGKKHGLCFPKKKKKIVFIKIAKKLVCSEYNTLMLLLSVNTDN